MLLLISCFYHCVCILLLCKQPKAGPLLCTNPVLCVGFFFFKLNVPLYCPLFDSSCWESMCCRKLGRVVNPENLLSCMEPLGTSRSFHECGKIFLPTLLPCMDRAGAKVSSEADGVCLPSMNKAALIEVQKRHGRGCGARSDS